MAKKTDEKKQKTLIGGRQDKGKIYVDELYFRHVDQHERWRQEYEHNQLLENKLAEFSKLTYKEIDYASQLVRAIFKERVIPDFSYLLEKARADAEEKFFMPIVTHLIAIVILVVLLIFSTNSILLWGSGASIVIIIIIMCLMFQKRNDYIKKILLETQQEIDRKIAYEEKKIIEEKKKHDDNEDERINIIERLLTGEVPSILAKIENVLSNDAFPFYLSVDIELYNDVPSVKIWLPPKSLIPTQICTLTPTGRLNYEDKALRIINRQYLELCASLVVKIMSTIYAYIPTFNTGYVYGMSKEDQEITCLISCKLDRETLIGACNAANGVAGIQRAQAIFEYDTTFEMLPVEFYYPPEWGNFKQQAVRNVNINLFR